MAKSNADRLAWSYAIANRFILVLLSLLTAMSASLAAEGESAQMALDVGALSIEELGNIEISSVSKKAEPISTAPAAVYVITNEDIHRSGATSIPEMLRLAPNLQVAQVSSSAYAISARGFNSTLANKLLVLIDGRSVYTSLYGGVYWDMQDVPREDIDRIEVISGPGATLWGANAVNGVINIITRKSADTQGGVFRLGGSAWERDAGLQYGGRLTDDLTYRVYAQGFMRSPTLASNGKSAQDRWATAQGGFRADWSRATDSITVQGDIYDSSERQPNTVDQSVSGRNLLLRWQHHLSGGSEVQVQAYYDRTHRFDTGGFTLDTYDVDAQHSFSLGSWNDVVWGGGYRINRDHITNVAAFQILPVSRTSHLGNVFAQDTVSLTKALKVTAGVKLEDDPYSGLAVLPNGRIAWEVSDSALLWAAVSRAVRAPTRFDRDVVEKLGALVFLTGGPNFQSEKLTAYEVGTRIQVSTDLSFSISTFYNVYDDLRSTESTPVTVFPLYWGNLMAGRVYGLEAWATYRVNNWWRLNAGFNVQQENLRFKPGSSRLGGLEQAGNDPDHQLSVRSDMNLGNDVTFNLDLRYIGPLPKPVVPIYVELNSRLGWDVSKYLEISISGVNLLHAHHVEFATGSGANALARSAYLEARWRF